MAIYPDRGIETGPQASADGEMAAESAGTEADLVRAESFDGDRSSTEPIALVPPPTGWSDPLTGADGPRLWERLIATESARVQRYRRPATIVVVEIAGLERLARLWGPDVAEQMLMVAARTLSREIRSSDHIARIDTQRFAVLLTETTEIEAINFVERARVSCEAELRIASEIVAIAFGWASPPPKRGLPDALALAERRLAAELRER